MQNLCANILRSLIFYKKNTIKKKVVTKVSDKAVYLIKAIDTLKLKQR